MFTEQELSNCKVLTKKILNMDPYIRFVGLINERGRLITGSVRKNVKFYVKDTECEMLFMEASLRMRMRHEFDKCLGPLNFCMEHRGNLIITKYPFGKEFLYVSAEKGFDFVITPFQILKNLAKRSSSYILGKVLLFS